MPIENGEILLLNKKQQNLPEQIVILLSYLCCGTTVYIIPTSNTVYDYTYTYLCTLHRSIHYTLYYTKWFARAYHF